MRLARGGCVRPVAVVRFYWDVLCSFAPIIRSYRDVLCSITPAVCRLCAKQDALRDVAFLFRRGSGSPFVRSRMSRGYRTWLVYFGLARFFMAIPTENERDGGTRRTESAARQSAFLRDRIGFAVFSAGSPLGAARPQTCAKEPLAIWTLLRGWTSGKVRFARRGWGGADSRRRYPGIRKAPPGSDKRRPHCGWPGGSGCILLTFLALRGSKWNRHSRRAARRQRRGVGLTRAKRSGRRHCRPSPWHTERPVRL